MKSFLIKGTGQGKLWSLVYYNSTVLEIFSQYNNIDNWYKLEFKSILFIDVTIFNY